jgi:hypothetical protein
MNEAEKLQRQVMDMEKKLVGEECPHTLSSTDPDFQP